MEQRERSLVRVEEKVARILLHQLRLEAEHGGPLLEKRGLAPGGLATPAKEEERGQCGHDTDRSVRASAQRTPAVLFARGGMRPGQHQKMNTGVPGTAASATTRRSSRPTRTQPWVMLRPSRRSYSVPWIM